ncbi:MAG: adenylosuccinate synthase [Gemmatimonadetes bacterium]|jgi:adenylosuccinate synthase|nr:adenylosuccinate synthase [Gemmatimonadota bacterium]MBT6146910.1 adenylosuccinate synthase [Gemmatimonadota bacterium]MBT7859845.1 adenylosuccinate synthase [Gemmatimonadota bacterium]
MTVTAIVGASWGDEGKGKITDALAAEADLVVRFQGGRNAGHTIINEQGRFALHLLPSGVFNPQTTNLIGPGVAFDAPAFFAELDELTAAGVPAPKICIASRAQLALEPHVLHDQYEEERLGGAAFGSTRAGIAPFYADKAMKIGVQVGDLLDMDWLRERLTRQLAPRNTLFEHLYGRPRVEIEPLLDSLAPIRERILPLLVDSSKLLHESLAKGDRILLEGQLGALRDVDHGIYPYSTSSSPLAGHAAVGAGLPPWAITDIVVVAKAYSSCVGAGPFVTEWEGEQAQSLRDRGGDRGEYGATTGRPRRVGPFDAVAARYGCRVQGATRVALTNLDVLGTGDEIPICVAYELEGEELTDFPLAHQLDRCRPVYEMMPGWSEQIGDVSCWSDLPTAARNYAERIEACLETPIGMISVGPHRRQLLTR